MQGTQPHRATNFFSLLFPGFVELQALCQPCSSFLAPISKALLPKTSTLAYMKYLARSKIPFLSVSQPGLGIGNVETSQQTGTAGTIHHWRVCFTLGSCARKIYPLCFEVGVSVSAKQVSARTSQEKSIPAPFYEPDGSQTDFISALPPPTSLESSPHHPLLIPTPPASRVVSS